MIGLNIGVLVQAAPQIFGEVMGELFALIAAGVLTPPRRRGSSLSTANRRLTHLLLLAGRFV